MTATQNPATGAGETPANRPPRETKNDFCDEVRRRVAEVVVGQDVVVERILIALFTGGHLMLQGVPGLAKTLLVNAVAKAIDLAEDVILHRIRLTYEASAEGHTGREILESVLVDLS